MMNKLIFSFSIMMVITLISACAPAATPSPTIAPTLTNTPTSQPPTTTPVPPTSTPTPLPPTATPTPPPNTDELAGQLLEQIYPAATPEPDSFGGIRGVAVTPLEVGENEPPLWLAHSYGLRDFMAEQLHFVAIYTYDDGTWQQLAGIEMDDADYVDEASVQQVMLEPKHIWLELHAGVGAHSGTYHVMQFDGRDLNIALSGFSPSPGAGYTADLNDDGQLEVILDTTNPYIFCYACGVRLPGFQVWQWNGNELVEVTLTDLPKAASGDAQEINNQAVTLAQAGLWKDAQTAVTQAKTIDPTNQTVIWNEILITLHTEEMLNQIETESGFPLLAYVFYGDYAGAIDQLRDYTPAEIFSMPSPVTEGTPASGWEEALSEWLLSSSNKALAIQPDLAGAYFLRAWGKYLVNPSNPQIIADLEMAAQLDPDEPLFTESQAYLAP